MKVLLTRSVAINGAGHCEGETLELSDDVAKTLIVINKAISLDPPREKNTKTEAKAQAPVVEAPEDDAVESEEIVDQGAEETEPEKQVIEPEAQAPEVEAPEAEAPQKAW